MEIAKKVKTNKSKSYILPLISDYVGIKFLESIINTYIFTSTDSSLKCIHILYDISIKSSPHYQEYVSDLSVNLLLKDLRIIPQGVVVSLFLPEEHYDDYNYFLLGKYSEFQDTSKRKILYFLHSNYPGLYDTIKKVEAILYRKDELKKYWENFLGITLPRDVELSSIIDIEEETLIE